MKGIFNLEMEVSEMIQWYCEDGNDNWIEIFDTKKKAKEYAEIHNNVLEIHKYNHIFKKGTNELSDIEHLGCIWMREGWNGFEFTTQ